MAWTLPSRWGGGFLLASAALFGVFHALGVGLEAPTANHLLDWVSSNAGLVMVLDETLVFAAVCLVPGLLGWAPRASAPSQTLGLALLGAAVPVWIIADLCLGRLVYPVYGLSLSPEVAGLCVSLAYGALHMASLLVVAALVCLSVAEVRTPFGVLGLFAAVGQLAAAFPWYLGPWGTLAAQSLFVVWLGWAGWRVRGSQSQEDRTHSPDSKGSS